MGLFKGVRKVVKKVGSAVLENKLTKPITNAARTVYAATAPVTTGVGLFVQPKVLGIKSDRNQRVFDTSQKIARVAAAGAVAAYSAPTLSSLTGGAKAGTGLIGMVTGGKNLNSTTGVLSLPQSTFSPQMGGGSVSQEERVQSFAAGDMFGGTLPFGITPVQLLLGLSGLGLVLWLAFGRGSTHG